jgi:tetratricopeptide (TPR) repeat protein
MLGDESDEGANVSAEIADALVLAKQLLNKGQFSDAIGRLEGLLQKVPDHQEALYIMAVCLRYNNQPQQALTVLDQLLELCSDYARAHQERGHLLFKQGQTDHAVAAYEAAVALNPALLASWQNLTALYKNLGQKKHSQHCREQADHLAKLPRELLSVTSMIHEGKLYQAEQLCRAFVQKNRRHVEGMRLLAKIATEMDILDDADFLLESCVEFAPEYLTARCDYAQVLFKRQRYQKSLEQAAILLNEQPENPAFRLLYANAAVPVGEIDKAIELYDQLIEQAPDNLHYSILKGHALKTLGAQQGAVEAYRRAATLKPDHGDAYWSLANLKTYRFTSDEIAQMISAENAEATTLQDRYQLCFSLGKHFEDNAEYTRAFEFYLRGNRLKNQECGYRADKTELEFSQQRDVCTDQFFADRVGYGVEDDDPIFIVGLPRSGSTLLEQVLASHPLVDGTIELPNMLSLAQKLAGKHNINEQSRYPAILQNLSQEQCRQFASDYLESTKVYRTGARYFTDKMPNNFRHIGLIHLLFPHAKIIDARRHPMACCFSNFKQLYGEGQAFSYGLEDLGRYYKDYVALVGHWQQVLPGKILRVQYEDVVEDLESQVRRLLDFLTLPFDPACLDFHKNERAVHTPSAEQVRQPIFQSGIDQWKHFEEHMYPLKDALAL